MPKNLPPDVQAKVADAAKNIDVQKTETANTDSHRTPPMTPGYQPNYGQSVEKIPAQEPEQKR